MQATTPEVFSAETATEVQQVGGKGAVGFIGQRAARSISEDSVVV